MQRLEVSGAVRHTYVISRLKVKNKSIMMYGNMNVKFLYECSYKINLGKTKHAFKFCHQKVE
jgi:hypothetical protein